MLESILKFLGAVLLVAIIAVVAIFGYNEWTGAHAPKVVFQPTTQAEVVSQGQGTCPNTCPNAQQIAQPINVAAQAITVELTIADVTAIVGTQDWVPDGQAAVEVNAPAPWSAIDARILSVDFYGRNYPRGTTFSGGGAMTVHFSIRLAADALGYRANTAVCTAKLDVATISKIVGTADWKPISGYSNGVVANVQAGWKAVDPCITSLDYLNVKMPWNTVLPNGGPVSVWFKGTLAPDAAAYRYTAPAAAGNSTGNVTVTTNVVAAPVAAVKVLKLSQYGTWERIPGSTTGYTLNASKSWKTDCGCVVNVEKDTVKIYPPNEFPAGPQSVWLAEGTKVE